MEEKYAKSFQSADRGQKAESIRVALSALIIQQRCGFSDRETIQQIAENSYLQYSIGKSGLTSLCTDNEAMIGAAAFLIWDRKQFSLFTMKAKAY